MTDAHVHAGLGQRGAQHPQQRHAALEQVDELVDLGGVPQVAALQQAGGAFDVQRLLDVGGELGEGRARSARGRRARSVDRPGSTRRCCEHARAEPSPTRRSLKYSPAHASSPGSTGRSKRGEHLRDPSRGGDDHDEHELGLKREHLDVADRGRVRARAPRRSPPGWSCARASRRSRARPRRSPGGSATARAWRGGASRRLAGAEQPVDDVAVGGVGGHPPGGHVGV